jgi:hypothetical protein
LRSLDAVKFDAEGKALGGGYYPYARKLGGVSLFDFDQFDPETYGEKFPMCSWQTFVPYRQKWSASVWIEIDREQVAAHLISGSDLVAKWKADEAWRHAIMPFIEAAHLGPIPRAAFLRAFLVREGDRDSQIQPCVF